MMPGEEQTGYVVPSYRAQDDEAWYHFLHGNVPGHQIDFMYRAEVPQGRLTRQHFSHLSRLMKYIEPQTNAPYAFAIGNLSRDDTQHEPGHGGLALIFGLRIKGVTDHAGRQDPPFSHGVAVVDRELDAPTLLAAARAFHRHVFGAAESAEWYRAYVRCALEAPREAPSVLAGYVRSFDDLPRPRESALSTKWIMGTATPPKRVILVHPDDAPFDTIARCAVRVAAMLYPSDLRWTAISNGREADVPNGVSVRIVAESALTSADEALGPRWVSEVPEDEAEIARQLFGAGPAVKARPAARGWRERYSAVTEEGSSVDLPPARASWEGRAPPRLRSERPPPQDLRNPPRESGEHEADWAAVRTSDPDAPTAHWHEGGSPPVRASVDDQAVTVGAPLQRAPAPGPSRAEEIDVSLDEDDGGGRRASLDLAPAVPTPPGDEQPTQHAGFQRETMQLSPEEAKRSLAGVLPFRPAPAPAAIPPPPSPRPPPASEEIPDFRRSSFSSGKWLLVLALVAAAVIGALYFVFAEAAPTPATSTPSVTPTALPTPASAAPASAAPASAPPTPRASAAPSSPPAASSTSTGAARPRPPKPKPSSVFSPD